MSDPSPSITIRAAAAGDLEAVVTLDRLATGVAKPGYWRDVVDRYITARRANRVFLVAEAGGDVVGFVVGEVRAWEFGSPPCGWVFAVNVSPGLRERKIGSRLLDEICARFKVIGVDTVRTMISRRDTLNLSFFRSLGLTAGPFIELEKPLD